MWMKKVVFFERKKNARCGIGRMAQVWKLRVRDCSKSTSRPMNGYGLTWLLTRRKIVSLRTIVKPKVNGNYRRVRNF